MMSLFRRRPAAQTNADVCAGLGAELIALRLDSGDVAPAQTVLVVFDGAGHARRTAPGKVVCAPGEAVFCYHPGPYTVDLLPFAAAPEWGLRLRFVVDAANPRVAQQRFDLYLYSETAGRLSLDGFAASVQTALQAELAQGALELPPCTTIDEWHAFRAGLNQLMYTRYGVTVDDCVPVDLGVDMGVDFAGVLRARAAAVEETEATSVAVSAEMPAPAVLSESTAAPAAQRDAYGLRRLFLELPAVGSALRMLALPAGANLFPQQQALLQRLHMASLHVNTMPALAWTAPDQPLDAGNQRRRVAQTLLAVAALDEAWSLLARLETAEASQWAPLLDQADRICANLEQALAQRRLTSSSAPTGDDYPLRKEPSL